IGVVLEGDGQAEVLFERGGEGSVFPADAVRCPEDAACRQVERSGGAAAGPADAVPFPRVRSRACRGGDRCGHVRERGARRRHRVVRQNLAVLHCGDEYFRAAEIDAERHHRAFTRSRFFVCSSASAWRAMSPSSSAGTTSALTGLPSVLMKVAFLLLASSSSSTPSQRMPRRTSARSCVSFSPAPPVK